MPHDWHNRDVEKVSDAGTAQMSVGKAYDCGVAVVIAGTPVPLLRYAGGAELNHPERHISPHEHVSVSARTDSQVNIVRVGLALPATADEE